VQAVIFDFGNVIDAFDTGIFLGRLAVRCGRTAEELSSAIYGSGLHREYEAGRISSRAFYETAARRCGLNMTEEEFFAAFTGIFTPIPGTRELIRALAGAYRLGLLSNTNERHFEDHIRRCSVFPLFDAVTVSHRVHALKPEEAIYREVLARIGVPAGACVYIDDIPEYVEGARAVGMVGIRYVGHGDLTAALRAAGVRLPAAWPGTGRDGPGGCPGEPASPSGA